MKVKFLLIIFLFWLLLVQSQDFENSLLWKISGNGLKQPSYVFGTMHLVEKKMMYDEKTLVEKLKMCSVLVFETDINPSLSQQLQIVNSMKLPYNKTLRDYMSPRDFEWLENECLNKYKISKNQFNTSLGFKPVFLSTLIAVRQIKNPVKYEKYLYRKGKKAKLTIEKLEELDEQIAVFDNFTIEEQCQMLLLDTISNSDSLFVFYERQDIASLNRLAISSQSEKFQEVFLWQRNRNWIPKIERLMNEKPTFVAVGAAHLAGKYGVLTLLRQRGYTVEPVFPSKK